MGHNKDLKDLASRLDLALGIVFANIALWETDAFQLHI